jgi:hypothetical protein
VTDVVPKPLAELTRYGDAAVIVITPVEALRRIPGVTLVPLPDGRALISLEGALTTPDFELSVRDVLDENRDMEVKDRSTLASIVEILKTARRTPGISVRQRSIIVLQMTRRARSGRDRTPSAVTPKAIAAEKGRRSRRSRII